MLARITWLVLVLLWGRQVAPLDHDMLLLPGYPASCPYAASWLVHVAFFLRVRFSVTETKLEKTSFLMLYKAKPAFQFTDRVAYYVNHLSEYEHKLTRRSGLKVALVNAKILSSSARDGECRNVSLSPLRGYLVVIPYLGTKGKGNSVVDAESKLNMLLATLCSCAPYYGAFVVGVAREEDRDQLKATLLSAYPDLFARIHIVLFDITGSFGALPYQTLTWAQRLVLDSNCRVWALQSTLNAPAEFYMCDKQESFPHVKQRLVVVSHDKPVVASSSYTHVYFTESDQLVRFANREIFQVAAGLANVSSFVVARRREKNSFSPAAAYARGLGHGRDCGQPGYVVRWPHSVVVESNSSGVLPIAVS